MENTWGMNLRSVKAYYVSGIEKKDVVISAVQEKFGKRAETIESWMVISGEEGEDLEYFKLSMEEDKIKVLVKISDRSLLQFFSDLLGEPVKIK
ncbi:MAG: hypothetical protein EAX95_04080 [Candidatus Thorarchaeota archaeon]|nr:hypothetical protein [Candidatus Thorarchaeota archaeon]